MDNFSISKDLREYMTAMVRLKSAIDYFTLHHPGSPEYSAVVSLHHNNYHLLTEIVSTPYIGAHQLEAARLKTCSDTETFIKNFVSHKVVY